MKQIMIINKDKQYIKEWFKATKKRCYDFTDDNINNMLGEVV